MEHMHNKYSEHGYIRLWMQGSPNEENLRKIRNLIHNEKELRKIFNTIYEEESASK